MTHPVSTPSPLLGTVKLVASRLLAPLRLGRSTTPDIAGMSVPPERLKAIRPEDRLLVSYPRSGNTWLRHLLRDVIALGKPSLPYPEEIPVLIPDLHMSTHDMDHPAVRDFDRPIRIFKSHNIRHIRNHPFVYLIREPADALVSFYHFRLLKKSNPHLVKDGIDAFCCTMVDGWIEHVRLALEAKRKGPENVLIVSYEGLIENGITELRRIAEFFQIQTNDEHCAEALQRSSFSRLRSKEEEKRGPSSHYFYRKGKRGSAREELKQETLEMLAGKAGEIYKAATSCDLPRVNAKG